MKFYIIAGEASGDLHASNLIREIKKLMPGAEFRCWGGDLMEQQGAVVVRHYRDLAFMGFLEVLLNLRTILRNLSFCKKDIVQYRPDAVILVDYPGFNLRMAKFVHRLKIPVIYYISPQLWAWKQSRVKTIRSSVDKMIVILPFEKAFYARHGIEVEFAGHPLLDALSDRTSVPVLPGLDRKLVALLPGSRQQEIRKVLPVMLSVTRHFPDTAFAIAGVPTLGESFYRELMPDSTIPVIMNRTYDLLKQSAAALVTSGTATLETALAGVPEVVCYRGGVISYLIARQVVKVKYISLVNLIMDKPVVRELIQAELNENNLKEELSRLLYDEVYRTQMNHSFNELKQLLGGSGASAKAASAIAGYLTT